jgi:hypothetical protein
MRLTRDCVEDDEVNRTQLCRMSGPRLELLPVELWFLALAVVMVAVGAVGARAWRPQGPDHALGTVLAARIVVMLAVTALVVAGETRATRLGAFPRPPPPAKDPAGRKPRARVRVGVQRARRRQRGGGY